MSEWISVTERLPESPEYDWVLVQIVLLGREPFYGVPHIAELRRGVWYSTVCEEPMEEYLSVKVTHWMPLPAFPEEPVIPGPEWMIKEYIKNDVESTKAVYDALKSDGPNCLGPVVNYICDRRACAECKNGPEFMRCSHTQDIRHAKNFEMVDGAMFEKCAIQYCLTEPLHLKIEEQVKQEEKLSKIVEMLNKIMSRQRPKYY